MSKLLLAAACLILLQTTGHSEEPADISKRFTEAKDAFYAERDKAEQVLLESLTRKENAAKQAGDIKTIETVRAEIDAFRNEGKLPKSVPLTAFNISMKSARTKLENVYTTAIKAATQADKLDEAKAIQKLLDQLRQTDPTRQKLRVMTYYSRHAEDGLKNVASAITSVDADIVGLPSLERSVKRSGNVDQPSELSKLTKLPHHAYGKNINFDGGEHGIAILSRWPIKTYKHYLLPMPSGGEQRGLSVAQIELPDTRKIIFCCIALDGVDKNQIASIEFVNKMADAQPNEPVILAGVLSEKPDNPLITGMSRTWTRAKLDKDLDKQNDYLMFRPANRFGILKPEARVEGQKIGLKPVWCELELK